MTLHEHSAGSYPVSETTFGRTMGEDTTPSTDLSKQDQLNGPEDEQFDAVLAARLAHVATAGLSSNLGGEWGPNRQINSAVSGKPQL